MLEWSMVGDDSQLLTVDIGAKSGSCPYYTQCLTLKGRISLLGWEKGSRDSSDYVFSIVVVILSEDCTTSSD
jgi:hypothetical protein